jgi:hypothetical protein
MRVLRLAAHLSQAKSACGGPHPMANRRQSSSRLVEDLRLTIDCMPVATRVAMLDGVRGAERIIVGAYVDRDGGICPMLAAHRCGGRTNFLSFAKAWDRFTRAGRRARRATRRELNILVGQLEGSLMSAAEVDLDRAIGEHREILGRREREQRDPVGEIVARRRGMLRRVLVGDDSADEADRRLQSSVPSCG